METKIKWHVINDLIRITSYSAENPIDITQIDKNLFVLGTKEYADYFTLPTISLIKLLEGGYKIVNYECINKDDIDNLKYTSILIEKI